MIRRTPALLALGLVASWAPSVGAQVCEESPVNGALQYLRRLSVDLRGRLPDLAESEAVVADGAVSPQTLDGLLSGDDFGAVMVAWHRDLLWTNLEDQRLQLGAFILDAAGRGGADTVLWSRSNARTSRYRGGAVGCLDEPARYDSEGEILTTLNDQGERQEGWVEVEPYWAPGQQVKVCAFDAQDRLTTPNPGAGRVRELDCSTTIDARCGCGPNLRFCGSRANRTIGTITESMDAQLLRFARDVATSGRPYTDLLLAKDMEINGPLTHYYRYQSQTGGNLTMSGLSQNFDLPDLSYDDVNTWVEVDRGLRHAGLLTMPGYLIKFASNRGRANRFYNAFLCSPFQAPPDGLPAADDACHDEPNLSKRCGCKHCHIAVEPAAAHWGRWTDAGQLALNEDEYPTEVPECLTPGGLRSRFCRRSYLLQANHPDEEPYLGYLRAYVFADADRAAIIEAGPGAIAQDAVDSGLFAECTVRQAWMRLMHREPSAGDADALAEVTEAFIAGGYVYTELIRTLVTRPEYVHP